MHRCDLPPLVLVALWFLALIGVSVTFACDANKTAKRPPKSAYPVQIPINCVTGGYANRSFCTAIEGSPDLVLCKDIILKYACVHVASGPKAEEVKAKPVSPDVVRDNETK
jgi:hypothetical protein